MRLKSFTADPRAIASYGPLQSEEGRRFTLKGVRPAGGGSPDLVIARVEGIATREAAEMLNRIRLYAPRERLHGPEGEDEFLLADLIGLLAKDKDGATIGTVVAVPNYGGGDLLEVAPQGGGPTGLLPFTQSFVPRIDIAAGEVVIDPPEGFFDPSPSPPVRNPSPLVGEGREGGTHANIGQVSASTPFSNSPPQGGRGQVGANPDSSRNAEGE